MNTEYLTREMTRTMTYVEENPNYVTFKYEPEMTTVDYRTISADAFADVIDTTAAMTQTDRDTLRELQEYLITHLENEADTYAQIQAARAEDMTVRATDGMTARVITADEAIPTAGNEQISNIRYRNDWTVSSPYLVDFGPDYKAVWKAESEDEKRKAVGEKPSAEQVLDFLTT